MKKNGLKVLEGIRNRKNLCRPTNLAVCNIGRCSLTPLKYCVEKWVETFNASQS